MTGKRTLANDPLLGTTLDGRFKVESLISRGGLSVLYKGTDIETRNIVTIRVLSDRKSEDDQSQSRFTNAVKLVSAIEHENILPIVGAGTTSTEAPYLVLPYIDGQSVREKVEKDGPLSIEEAMPIIRQVAAALQCAHERGIVHRNLKPSNILLTNVDGKQRALLTGFGIAKKARLPDDKANSLAQTTKVVGSPLYMSPEQFINSTIDARSDIYSFGCVIHQMLCGKPPFEAPNLVQLMGAHHHTYRPHFNTISPDLKVPSYVEDVLDAATFKLPANRYASASDLVSDLDAKKCSINLRQARDREPQNDTGTVKQHAIKTIAQVSAASILLVALVIFIVSFESLSNNRPKANTTTGDISGSTVGQPDTAPNPTIEKLLETTQYSQAIGVLKNELEVASPKEAYQIHERIGALALLAKDEETATKHYQQAIEQRQKARQAGAEGLRHQTRIRENYALMAIGLLDTTPELSLQILTTKVGPGVVHGIPAAYLVWKVTERLDNESKDTQSREIYKMFPKDEIPDRHENRITREDLDQYLINFVRTGPST